MTITDNIVANLSSPFFYFQLFKLFALINIVFFLFNALLGYCVFEIHSDYFIANVTDEAYKREVEITSFVFPICYMIMFMAIFYEHVLMIMCSVFGLLLIFKFEMVFPTILASPFKILQFHYPIIYFLSNGFWLVGTSFVCILLVLLIRFGYNKEGGPNSHSSGENNTYNHCVQLLFNDRPTLFWVFKLIKMTVLMTIVFFTFKSFFGYWLSSRFSKDVILPQHYHNQMRFVFVYFCIFYMIMFSGVCREKIKLIKSSGVVFGCFFITEMLFPHVLIGGNPSDGRYESEVYSFLVCNSYWLFLDSALCFLLASLIESGHNTDDTRINVVPNRPEYNTINNLQILSRLTNDNRTLDNIRMAFFFVYRLLKMIVLMSIAFFTFKSLLGYCFARTLSDYHGIVNGKYQKSMKFNFACFSAWYMFMFAHICFRDEYYPMTIYFSVVFALFFIIEKTNPNFWIGERHLYGTSISDFYRSEIFTHLAHFGYWMLIDSILCLVIAMLVKFGLDKKPVCSETPTGDVEVASTPASVVPVKNDSENRRQPTGMHPIGRDDNNIYWINIASD